MYKRKEQGWFKHLDFILLDALCGQLALFLAHGWRHGFRPGLYGIEIYRNLAIWMGLFSVVIAILFNTMHDVLKRRWTTELRQTLTQCLLVFGTVVIYLFSVKGSEQYSRITLWLSLGLYAVLAFVTRMLWKQFLQRRLRRSKSRAVLLVADEASAGEIMARFKAHSLENIGLSGIVLVDRDATGESLEDVPVVCNLESAAQYICREWIDEVYIGVEDAALTPYELIDKCREMGVTIHLQMLRTGMGKQAVITLAVTNKKIRDELAEDNRMIGGWKEGFDPFYGAPAVLIVLAKKDFFTSVYDGSLVMGNLMLAAHSLGLGSIWIHRAKEEFEMDKYKKLLKDLGVEGEWEGIGHCAIGYIEGGLPKAAPRAENRVFFVD